MARDFNGSTDRIDYTGVASLSATNITISAWVYPDAMGVTAGTLKRLSNFQNSADTGDGIQIMNNSPDGGVTFNGICFRRAGSTNKQRVSTALTGFTTGEWQHVLALDGTTFTDATQIRIYRNGSEVSYGVTTNGVTETTASGTWAVGGRTFSDSNCWDGRVAEFAVWNVQLGTSEITSLAAGFSPLLIRPASLLFYIPLIRDPNDLKGKVATLDGTTVIEHPRIIQAA